MELHKILYLAMIVAFAASMGIAAAEEVCVIGVVEKKSTDLILKAMKDRYIIAGGNLSAMIGKTVKATGTISEKGNTKTFTVVSAEEVAK